MTVLLSGDPAAGESSRFSFFCTPTEVRRLSGDAGPEQARAFLRELWTGARDQPRQGPPFQSGWVVALAYDLAPLLHPRVPAHAQHRAPPLAVALRCPSVLTHDAADGTWRITGPEAGASDALAALRTGVQNSQQTWHAGPIEPEPDALPHYTAAVARAAEYIRAGDVYQVNLAHRCGFAFEGSARAYFEQLARVASPWMGAYLEWDESPGMRCALASASPELFLRFDAASRSMLSRPMKGTRARKHGDAAHAELAASTKDRAELAMIVDLMRNDLGRSAEFGSVRIERAREIERHGSHDAGVLQATATVACTLRFGLHPADALLDAFPGGSVTGAPKVRAMQIIRELEPHPRSFYCGCIGFIDDRGNAAFNIAIRTAELRGKADPSSRDGLIRATGHAHFGAGIVADSTPEGEWQETLDKAAVFRAASAQRVTA